jgi:hypothetical protein
MWPKPIPRIGLIRENGLNHSRCYQAEDKSRHTIYALHHHSSKTIVLLGYSNEKSANGRHFT